MKYLLHNIGQAPTQNPRIASNYNTIEEVLQAQEQGKQLTFDGIYKNVYEHRHLIDWDGVILFVVGDLMGKDNSFDDGMPLEHYCTLEQLKELETMGAELAWHTVTHPDLTTLDSKEALRREICPPEGFSKSFAYPYGRYNDTVVEIVKEAGFERAYSVTQGDDNKYTLRREYL